MPFLHFSVKMLATFSYSLYFCRKYHNEMTTSVALSKIRQTAISAIPDGGKAILYGSRARGDAHSNSDWDILILLDKDSLDQSDFDNVSYPFVLLGCDLGQEINPIMYTTKEWNSYKTTPFFENVEHDAINLLKA